MLICLLLTLLSCTGPPAPEHTVARGDTLSKLAKTYDVTVAELREWNGLSGDRIDVGQVLVVGEGGEPAPSGGQEQASVASLKGRRAGPVKSAKGGRLGGDASSGGGAAAGLSMPSPKTCLPPPTAQDAQGMEAGFASSQGLSRGQIKGAMDAALPTLTRCVQGEWPVGVAHLEITAGCDGRVTQVQVVDGGSLAPELLRCVQQTLSYAGFPAHDLPDGETFGYPLRFEGPI